MVTKKEAFESSKLTPNTTCLLSSQSHFAHVIKNCKHKKVRFSSGTLTGCTRKISSLFFVLINIAQLSFTYSSAVINNITSNLLRNKSDSGIKAMCNFGEGKCTWDPLESIPLFACKKGGQIPNVDIIRQKLTYCWSIKHAVKNKRSDINQLNA